MYQLLLPCMVLIWFVSSSGLKINLGKAELVPMGVNMMQFIFKASRLLMLMLYDK